MASSSGPSRWYLDESAGALALVSGAGDQRRGQPAARLSCGARTRAAKLNRNSTDCGRASPTTIAACGDSYDTHVAAQLRPVELRRELTFLPLFRGPGQQGRRRSWLHSWLRRLHALCPERLAEQSGWQNQLHSFIFCFRRISQSTNFGSAFAGCTADLSNAVWSPKIFQQLSES